MEKEGMGLEGGKGTVRGAVVVKDLRMTVTFSSKKSAKSSAAKED